MFDMLVIFMDAFVMLAILCDGAWIVAHMELMYSDVVL